MRLEPPHSDGDDQSDAVDRENAPAHVSSLSPVAPLLLDESVFPAEVTVDFDLGAVCRCCLSGHAHAAQVNPQSGHTPPCRCCRLRMAAASPADTSTATAVPPKQAYAIPLKIQLFSMNPKNSDTKPSRERRVRIRCHCASLGLPASSAHRAPRSPHPTPRTTMNSPISPIAATPIHVT
jgi:hypothetical protein